MSDEIIEDYQIQNGIFDTISNCKYAVPSALDIGKWYSIMLEDCVRQGEGQTELEKIFTSFISDEISNFKTGIYHQNSSYLEVSYKEEYLLE